MATIITVHGTFATGLEKGEDWWQKASEFERDIHRWVSSEDGQLHFQPFIWNGRNSELSRRAAAKALARHVARLEMQNHNYCLIGHSHGGSVIAGAIFDVCFGRSSIKSLSRWITIGTPFVSTQIRRFLVVEAWPDRKSDLPDVFPRLHLVGGLSCLCCRVSRKCEVARSSQGHIYRMEFGSVISGRGLIDRMFRAPVFTARLPQTGGAATSAYS